MERREDLGLLREFCAGRDVACPGCGYNLRDLSGDTCPECGEAVGLELTSAAPRWLVRLAGAALVATFVQGIASSFMQWRTDAVRLFAGQLEGLRASGLILMTLVTLTTGVMLGVAGLKRWRGRRGAGAVLVRSAVVVLGIYAVFSLLEWLLSFMI